MTSHKILEAFTRGRRRAIANAQGQAALIIERVADLIEKELERGLPKRGRAARIARQLRRVRSRRTIFRIVADLHGTLAGVQSNHQKRGAAMIAKRKQPEPVLVYGRYIAPAGSVVILPDTRAAESVEPAIEPATPAPRQRTTRRRAK